MVVFERDDILLKHKPQFKDQTLGDIDTDFVAVLRELRELDVRFGFISKHPTAPIDGRGRFDRATLTRQLDGILKVLGALPDFWIDAVCSSSLRRCEPLHSKSEVDLILKLTGWSEATTTVIIRKAEAPGLRPDTPGLTEIFYPGISAGASSGANRRATLLWLKTVIKDALDLE